VARDELPFAELDAMARQRAEALSASGIFTPMDGADLDERFEAAAVKALRVPVLAERYAGLRATARKVIPEPVRPVVRRVVRVIDRVLRRGFEAGERLVGRR